MNGSCKIKSLEDVPLTQQDFIDRKVVAAEKALADLIGVREMYGLNAIQGHLSRIQDIKRYTDMVLKPTFHQVRKVG